MVDSINSVVRDGLVAEHAMREGGMTLRLVQEMWIQLHRFFLQVRVLVVSPSTPANEKEGGRRALDQPCPSFQRDFWGSVLPHT